MSGYKENNWAIWYTGGAAIDGDGSPRCYGPPGTQPLDYLANAGHSGSWYGIVTDNKGKPIIQDANDPCPGYYISPTSLQDSNYNVDNPLRYVNSEKIPYLAVAGDLIRNGKVKLGDIGFAYNHNTNKFCGAIVADVGPSGHYGEISICLANAIGITNVSPKNGGASNGITCFIFKGSRRQPYWPKTITEICEENRQLVEGTGQGWDNLFKLF